jgi:ribonuclease HI
MVKYSDTLPHVTCDFTAECYGITTALEYIKSLNITKCLIVSDSQAALNAINSISISATTSPFFLNIKASLFELYSHGIQANYKQAWQDRCSSVAPDFAKW